MDRRLRAVGMVLVVLAAGSMIGGCRWFRLGRSSSGGSATSYDDTGYPTYSESDLVIENGFQSGDMGYVTGYSAATFVDQGYASAGYTNIRLESEGDGWWVMSLITVNGASLDELVPGRTYTTALTGTLEDGDLDVDVLGCSGPTQGNWTYDTHATRSELEVEDLGTGARRVTFRAWFDRDGETQLAEGSFDYRTVR